MSKVVIFLILFSIVSHADKECVEIPKAISVKAVPNFDGSWTFSNPQFSVNGDMLRPYGKLSEMKKEACANVCKALGQKTCIDFSSEEIDAGQKLLSLDEKGQLGEVTKFSVGRTDLNFITRVVCR